MDKEELLKLWLNEEEIAHFNGWVFSDINGIYD